ncbi:MAG: pseudouridine synthase [Aquabacterium sp.]|nr:pseudouridine synthase [Aquabacterium sp.]
MTERKKLSLTKPDQAPTDATGGTYRKPPVRGAGSAPRKRMTAAEAAQAREEAARREQQAPRREEQAPRGAYRDERADRRAPRGDPRGDQRGDARRAHGARDDGRPTEQAPSRRDHRRAEGRDASRPPREAGVHQTTPPAAPREDDGRLRLSKLMSEKGLASRREADEWIEQGWVRVDGEVVSELGTRVFPDQVITIDPLARTQQAQRVTILIHKPIGYVSGQAEDGYEPAVALIKPENRWSDDKLPIQLTRGHLKNLAPAGRLDIDSTGLLVLTQDGRIAKQLIGEDSGIEKEYLVRVVAMGQEDAENVSAVVPPEAIERLRFGLELDGRQLKPAQVSWQNEQQLRFVLREGRKRQIRRMCEQVGLKVVGLKRVRMGRITLGKLPQGQWRFLRPDERF